MHELALCQALIAQVEEVAAQHGAHHVNRVTLSVGPLAGVEPVLLESAYPLASAGTVADGSTLRIETAFLKVRCLNCGEVTDALPNRLLCAACGNYRTSVESGDELMLVSVDLATDQGGSDV